MAMPPCSAAPGWMKTAAIRAAERGPTGWGSQMVKLLMQKALHQGSFRRTLRAARLRFMAQLHSISTPEPLFRRRFERLSWRDTRVFHSCAEAEPQGVRGRTH